MDNATVRGKKEGRKAGRKEGKEEKEGEKVVAPVRFASRANVSVPGEGVKGEQPSIGSR